MKEIPKIELVTQSTPEQLRDGANIVRKLADQIEKGEIQAFCYAAIQGPTAKVEYIKPKGITMLEILGAAEFLADHIKRALKDGEE